MRVRTPTCIQMEEIESGAAALAIILGYFEKYVPLEQLRIDCGITRDGSLTPNIIQAANLYGLEAEKFSYTLEELSQLKAPYIVLWNIHHYLVVEKIDDEKVFINDPATGPRTVSLSDFKKNYSNVAIVLKPTSQFKKGGKRRTFFTLITKRLSGCKGPLSYLLLVGLLLLVPGIALPTLTQFFVDEILVRHLTSTAPIFVLGFLFTVFTAGLLTALQGYYLSRLNVKLSIRLSSQFLWHILRLPVEFYVQRFGGEIAYRLQTNDNIVQTLVGEMASVYISLLLVVVYGALMFIYDPAIAFIGIAVGIFNMLLLFTLYRQRTDANIRLQQDMGKRNGISINGLQNMETIKATGSESEFFSKWAGHFTKTMLSVQQIGKLDIILTIVPHFTHFVAIALVLTIGGQKVIRGEMTLGMLLGLLALMQTFLAPISRFVLLSQRIQNVNGGLNRVEDVLQNPIDPQLSVYMPKQERKKLTGDVEIKNLTFGYNKLTSPLLENFNLHIKPGQCIALVGPSGCGKSTLAKLLVGLYQPWSGDILFDQKPFSHISRGSLNSSIGIVDQQIFLFSGTIRENLSLWDESLPEEDIFRASLDTGMHDEIIQRENGYDCEVLEGASNFSGGQKQLLEITRALALNPTFLILDEATSALDALTEEKVLSTIRKRECSSLIISHRLSTIRDCDEILLLGNGKILSRGTHESLKNKSEQYLELLKGDGHFYAQ